MYRVRVSKIVKGKELIPPIYNVQTELGFEAADDIENVFGDVAFDLKKR